jgi:hypothetical protein
MLPDISLYVYAFHPARHRIIAGIYNDFFKALVDVKIVFHQ